MEWNLMEERFVKVNGINIFYNKIGKGQPVLLIHGLGANWQMWGKLIPYLKKNFTVYAVDLPGHGKSDKPDVHYGARFYASFIIGFIEALNLDKVVLIGESMGGHAAIKVASRLPHIIDKLVLVASSGLSPLYHGVFRLPGVAWIFTYLAGRWDFFNLWFFKEFFADKHYVSKGVFKEYINRLKEPGAKRAYYRTIMSVCSSEKGLLDEVIKIKSPTLVVWGHDDQVMLYDDAFTLINNIKESRLAVIYRCGHVPPVEKHREFNGAVLDFIMQK